MQTLEQQVLDEEIKFTSALKDVARLLSINMEETPNCPSLLHSFRQTG
jgi:hypothetical protein